MTQLDLPEFPESHFWSFWKRTNKDKQLIEQRRQEIEYYLNVVFNEPKIRGLPAVKRFLLGLKN